MYGFFEGFFTTQRGVYNFTLTPLPPPDSYPSSLSQWTLAQLLGPYPMWSQPMEPQPMELQSGGLKLMGSQPRVV